MKIGLFGGTFNPIHFGHVFVAIEVQRRFCFDFVYFIPSRKPPHKSTWELVGADDRCEMISRALPRDLPFALSRVELNRNGPSYSVDTVDCFKARLSPEDGLFFILGIDAFLELHTWKNYNVLLTQVEFIVVSRPGNWFKKTLTSFEAMQNYIAKEVLPGYRFCYSCCCWQHEHMKPIHYFKIKSPNISSALVRLNVKLGGDFDLFVPSTVADYIKGEELYL